jgi:hypothetical protein
MLEGATNLSKLKKKMAQGYASAKHQNLKL